MLRLPAILASRAAALLGALATAFHRRVIKVSAVALIGRRISEACVPGGYSRSLWHRPVHLYVPDRPIGIFFHPDVGSDAAFIESSQQFAVAIGGIRGQCLRLSVDRWPSRIALAVLQRGSNKLEVNVAIDQA